MPIPIVKTVLDNGLTVQLKEIHTAPLISHWMWYRVGSRDEVPGKTGISHWVEHMQFKGTPHYPAGILDKAISRDGGIWNAFTYMDWTTYFETLPADKISLALELEADRMVNSTFNPQEVESERTVVISEREGSENEPLFRLSEAMQTQAFQSHPYRNEVIGSIEDLRKIKRDDLYQHYHSYYTPGNAILAMAGDFKAEEMLEQIKQLFKHVPSAPLPPHPAQPELPLSGERRVDIKGPGETTFLKIAYRAPAASHADYFAFTLLDSLLTGPSSLSMIGGGGISNRTSRLYRLLVEKELAVHVSGSLQATIDPFLYEITATIHPKQTPEAVLTAIDGEIKRLQEEPISTEDITRAVKQARALFAYSSENITNQAFWLGYAEVFAHYDWFINYLEQLGKVTTADLLQTAQKYLQPAQRVVGTYIPDGNQGGEE